MNHELPEPDDALILVAHGVRPLQIAVRDERVEAVAGRFFHVALAFFLAFELELAPSLIDAALVLDMLIDEVVELFFFLFPEVCHHDCEGQVD